LCGVFLVLLLLIFERARRFIESKAPWSMRHYKF
jgi:hypothetical protein